jgi:hypothetical protein
MRRYGGQWQQPTKACRQKQSGDGSKIIALLDNSPSAQLPAGKRSVTSA